MDSSNSTPADPNRASHQGEGIAEPTAARPRRREDVLRDLAASLALSGIHGLDIKRERTHGFDPYNNQLGQPPQRDLWSGRKRG